MGSPRRDFADAPIVPFGVLPDAGSSTTTAIRSVCTEVVLRVSAPRASRPTHKVMTKIHSTSSSSSPTCGTVRYRWVSSTGRVA